MAIVPIKKVAKVILMNLPKPPILRMSCSPLNACITEPAPKNNNALKNA